MVNVITKPIVACSNCFYLKAKREGLVLLAEKERLIGAGIINRLFIVVITLTELLRFTKVGKSPISVFSPRVGNKQVPFIANWSKKVPLVASLLY